MDTTGYCTFCGVSPDTSGRCGCHVLQSSRRVARIRELATAWAARDVDLTPHRTAADAARAMGISVAEYNPTKHFPLLNAPLLWAMATSYVDEFHRLEAEERTKEADRES